jgi:hypothetical protein
VLLLAADENFNNNISVAAVASEIGLFVDPEEGPRKPFS